MEIFSNGWELAGVGVRRGPQYVQDSFHIFLVSSLVSRLQTMDSLEGASISYRVRM